MWSKPIAALRSSWLLIALWIAAGCHHVRGEAPRPARDPAEVLFWDVLHHQQHERIPEVIAALQRASAADPANARVVLLLATTHLWAVSEPALARTERPADQSRDGLAAFARYREMAPGDKRLPTWIGPLLAGSGFGIRAAAGGMPDGPQKDALLLQGQSLLDQSLAVLDAGVADEPRFNLFGRFITTGLFPIKTDRFRQAVGDVAALHDARLGARLDPRRPDVTPFLQGDSPCHPESPPPWPFEATSDETTFRPDPRCWNSWKTPFAYEGLWLYSGDILLKGGDVEAARITYRNAQKLPSYARWPYAVYVEDRLAHLDQWAARLTDSDPSNDPELIVRAPANCLVCHAAAGEKPILQPPAHATR